MNSIPTHVSIIMDGNGRWAKARGKERAFGHMAGAESVRAITEAAGNAGVKYLSLYAFSEENWNRPDAEVNALMELLLRYIKGELKTLMDNDIRFVKDAFAKTEIKVLSACYVTGDDVELRLLKDGSEVTLAFNMTTGASNIREIMGW